MSSHLHQRLQSVAGDRTYRRLSEMTQTHHETVRRYMLGQAPSVEFLTAFASAFGVNSEWLLTGRGPMKRDDLRGFILKDANPSELLNAVAETLEKLIERVDRLEAYTQMLETHVRAGGSWGASGFKDAAGDDASAAPGGGIEPKPLAADRAKDCPEGHHGDATTLHAPARVRRLADDLARRPHEDAH